MTRNVRLALLSALLLVAAVASFVALRPDSSDPAAAVTIPTVATSTATVATASTPEATTSTEASTPPPDSTEASPPSDSTAAAPPPATSTAESAPAATVTEPTTVVVRDGSPVGGVAEVTVTKGERVDLRITVDAPDELHVHGYDITRALRPGAPTAVSFPAELEGVFELELHGSGEQLVKLTVRPA